MQFLTDFADLAVVLPLSLCVAAWLGLMGWGRGARLWLAALFGMLAVMLLLKLVVLGCARGESALGSPSGHTASSTLVYGGIVTLGLRPRLAVTVAIGVALAALFGASRVAVHAHSVADVVAGGTVGVLALAGFAGVAGAPPPSLRPGRLVLVCIPLVLLLHGVRLNLEPRLRGAASWLGLMVCPPEA